MNDPTDPNPFQGLPDALKPNPPADIPQPQAAGDAMSSASPFKEALDYEQIKKNLVLDRPMKLFIPQRILDMFPDFHFRVINSIPSEIAAANNKGWSAVTHPEAVELFNGLVAGTDKTGKAYYPLLYGRPKAISKHIANLYRKQLASLYAGMDPSNKDLSGKYTANVDAKDGTKGQFTGAGFRIKTG